MATRKKKNAVKGTAKKTTRSKRTATIDEAVQPPLPSMNALEPEQEFTKEDAFSNVMLNLGALSPKERNWVIGEVLRTLKQSKASAVEAAHRDHEDFLKLLVDSENYAANELGIKPEEKAVGDTEDKLKNYE